MKEPQARATDKRLGVHASRRRLYALTFSDWRLLIVVAAAQVVAAGALRAMSLRAVRHRAAQLRPFVQRIAHASDERVIWATHATGRRLGRSSTCLTRALAAELVIERGGGLTFNIGVRRTAASTLQAHAWLARDERVLIGSTADRYAPIVKWIRRST